MFKLEIYEGRNSHVCRLVGLKNGRENSIISNATARLNWLKDSNGNIMSGVAWPLVFQPDASMPGDYYCGIPSVANVIAGERYDYNITVSANGLDGEWMGEVFGSKRDS